MSENEIDGVLTTPERVLGQRFPWPPGVIGSCYALRASRPAAFVFGVPGILLSMSSFPLALDAHLPRGAGWPTRVRAGDSGTRLPVHANGIG